MKNKENLGKTLGKPENSKKLKGTQENMSKIRHTLWENLLKTHKSLGKLGRLKNNHLLKAWVGKPLQNQENIEKTRRKQGKL